MDIKKRTALKNITGLVACFLLMMVFTAWAVQSFAEPSPLLKIYNWLMWTTLAIALFVEFTRKSLGKHPRRLIHILIILIIILCIMGGIICYQHHDVMPKIFATYLSR